MNSATYFSFDERASAATSAALRYGPGILDGLLTTAELAATSLAEGMRVAELAPYRGVRLCLLDESTLMRTGTYKSLDGCITTALCRRHGIARAVFSSGANTGVALSTYGPPAGLETFFFCPEKTLYKLDLKPLPSR